MVRGNRAGIYLPGLTARGGAERLALTLALSLSAMGWRVTVYSDTPVDQEQLATDSGEDVQGLRFVELPKAVNAKLPSEVSRLLSLKAHADIIRSHRLDVFFNAQFKSQLPGCGRRNIYYCHFPHKLDPFAIGGLRGLYQRVTSLADRLLVTQAPSFLDTYDGVWANSNFTASHVRDRWRVEPVVLYPPCEQMPTGPKERVIAVVGRFQAMTAGAPYKAQDVLIREFSKMADLHRQGWRLELAGGLGSSTQDHEYFNELRRAAEGMPVGLRPNVSHESIRALYSEASLYWHAQGFGADGVTAPQTQEHFGITTVEAMSAGCVPVVYGTAGPREVVAPVSGIRTWETGDELREITRTWASAEPGDIEPIRGRCRSRAEEFSRGAFEARLRNLLAAE